MPRDGVVRRESAGAFIALSVLYQLPLLFIRFPLEDAISIELQFFDAFPDVIQRSEREARRVSEHLRAPSAASGSQRFRKTPGNQTLIRTDRQNESQPSLVSGAWEAVEVQQRRRAGE